MNNLPLIVAGSIFGLVSVGHFIRFFLKWQWTIHNWSIPNWASLVAGIVALGLSVWMFIARSRS